MRISLDGIVIIYLDVFTFKATSICICTCLTVVVSDYNAADIQSYLLKLCTKAQYVLVIGDAKVSSDLVLLYIQCADYHYHLSLILELKQHLKLTVRLETRQYAACVIVIKKLTSELEIKLVSELSDTLLDLFGLYLKILVVIESRFHTEYKDKFYTLFLQVEKSKI
jgi:hypothetical protein